MSDRSVNSDNKNPLAMSQVILENHFSEPIEDYAYDNE